MININNYYAVKHFHGKFMQPKMDRKNEKKMLRKDLALVLSTYIQYTCTSNLACNLQLPIRLPPFSLPPHLLFALSFLCFCPLSTVIWHVDTHARVCVCVCIEIPVYNRSTKLQLFSSLILSSDSLRNFAKFIFAHFLLALLLVASGCCWFRASVKFSLAVLVTMTEIQQQSGEPMDGKMG